MEFDEKLVEECKNYIENEVFNYIKENIDYFLIQELNYWKSADELLENTSMKDGKHIYKQVLKEKENDLFIEFCNENNLNAEESNPANLWNLIYNDIENYGEKVINYMKDYLEKHIDDPNVNKYLTGEQLNELNDEIGNEIDNYRRFDYNDRDKAFIDIDGKIFVSGREETHATLVNEYLRSIGEESFDEDFSRPDNKDMSAIAEQFGFGMIEDNIWIVDNDEYFGNMSAEQIVDDIQNSEFVPDKIYISTSEGTLLRAAKYEVK